MIAGLRTLVSLRLSPTSSRAGAAPKSLQRSARAAMVSGLVVLAAASAALAVVVDVSHREWRDPEFGHRLIALRARKAEAPTRPLVLALGSSRIQQGIDPSAMELGNDPADPVVFNFGYRGAAPVVAVRNFFRILEAGERPDYVLIEFSPASAAGRLSAALVVKNWANRLTLTDVWWLRRAGYLDIDEARTEEALAKWAMTIATPWTSHRQVLMPHWLPEWVTEYQCNSLGCERMDRHGFTEMLMQTTTTAECRQDPRAFRERCGRGLSGTNIPEGIRRAYSLLIDRCRVEGIPVAVVWPPLAPLLQSFVSPEFQRACIEYIRELGREPGVTVFPPPDWVVDDDFADGQHLLPPAAAKYSRWLARTHLKPWLARKGALP